MYFYIERASNWMQADLLKKGLPLQCSVLHTQNHRIVELLSRPIVIGGMYALHS